MRFQVGDAPATGTIPAETGVAMPKAVLVIDDDPQIRWMLDLALRHEGYAVIPAENGQQALECLEERVPNLILLDLAMPEMDGPALAAELERRADLPRLPIIVMSADRDAGQKAAAIGAAAYLRKPFDLDDLFAVIERSGC
jgi:two-component system chemotaxis response regulator CheY